MIFVDASAIIGIIKQERDWRSLTDRLENASKSHVSPLVLWEATIGLSREGHSSLLIAERTIVDFIDAIQAETLDITVAVGALAIEASRRYGRGRHKAGLNFGDCFAYACAKAHDLPLLFKGEDFIHTDIKAA